MDLYQAVYKPNGDGLMPFAEEVSDAAWRRAGWRGSYYVRGTAVIVVVIVQHPAGYISGTAAIAALQQQHCKRTQILHMQHMTRITIETENDFREVRTGVSARCTAGSILHSQNVMKELHTKVIYLNNTTNTVFLQLCMAINAVSRPHRVGWRHRILM